MSRKPPRPRAVLVSVGLSLFAGAVSAEQPRFDLSRDKVLYCVGYAHLDTQWRWDFTTTIDRFIADTLHHNFERFERYPAYRFNFTGSVRYSMMREYYPEEYERLKRYVDAGRWFVSGSSVDEGDVNVPSAEATLRQILYGNQFFRREFGKESVDYMLPDCFGFPASMPSIWAHAGLRGFSTQKLTWGSAVGIPFKIGVWEGLDGESVIAALDPGPYSTAIQGRVDTNPEWVERVNANGRDYGVYADYHYYGVGDQGGAPRDEDVRNYVASIGNPDSEITVALVASDQMFKDITDEQRARLPRYRGDLLLTEHSAGTLTSQAYMKRWNRKNEILADAAERAAVTAEWLGGAAYPLERLNRSWERLLANQMHDILPGTSIPRAYTFSWNDELVAMNGFAAVLTDSVGAVTRALDTEVDGQPLVVYNPLATAREDLVEAEVLFDDDPPPAVRVFDPAGREVASQLLARGDHSIRVLFVARLPSLGFGVFDVRPSDTPYAEPEGLTVGERQLDNEHYRVRLDEAGDVASIVDKRGEGRELLSAPARLVFTPEKPRSWPAWNMDWADRQKPPVGFVDGPARIRVVERGPVRVALEVTREARDSVVTQRIRLARGEAGRRVEFATEIDWQSAEVALKAAFPLTVANPKATYNWGIGTIERGNNDPTKYEVPSHEWFDLTDREGTYGVAVLEDCKFGSDKPADDTVRLTLLYTPGVRRSYMDQHSQDWGRHEMTYALYGHPGDWREGLSEWQGRRLNQPLIPFRAQRHAGGLGRKFSVLRASTPQVDVRALKRAEQGDAIVVRLQELWGRAADGVEIAFAGGIASAWEVDGQERRIGEATLRDGRLVVDMAPFSPRSFAVRLGPAPVALEPPRSTVVALPFDQDAVSRDGRRADGRMDAEGRTLPAEMLPREQIVDGVRFELGPNGDGQSNAVAARGQTIPLPRGNWDRLYLLAAATEDTRGRFEVGGTRAELAVQAWTGFVGQFDDRIWDREFAEVDHRTDGKVVGIATGYIKRDPIAWFATHRHHPSRGNEAYRFSYLFKYGFDLPAGAESLKLPENEAIKIFAISLAGRTNDAAVPAAPLYDDFSGREPVELRHVYPPPPVPVFEGLAPAADVVADRAEDFAALAIGAPVNDDYADRSSANGVVFRIHDGGGEWAPHRRAGAVDGSFPRLNDGEVAGNDDDTSRCIWYDNEGRFSVDLGRSLPIERVDAYSWHRDERAPQFYSLWGSHADAMPDPDFSHGGHDGWQLLAVVDTRGLGAGGVHGSSIRGRGRPLGPYRHLLWVLQDVGYGTFFTEIDIHAED